MKDNSSVLYSICELEIRKKVTEFYNTKNRILSSNDANKIIRPYFDGYIQTKEIFLAAFVSSAHEVVTIYKMSEGGITSTVVDSRLFILAAANSLATYCFIFHNHPSGNLKASKQDIAITENLKAIGELINCKLLDHLIITEESYYSFADEGLL